VLKIYVLGPKPKLRLLAMNVLQNVELITINTSKTSMESWKIHVIHSSSFHV
jgi:hypothetical protein